MDLAAEIAYCEVLLRERRSRGNVREISFIFNEFLMPWWVTVFKTHGLADFQVSGGRPKTVRIGNYDWKISTDSTLNYYTCVPIRPLPPPALAPFSRVYELSLRVTLRFQVEKEPKFWAARAGKMPLSISAQAGYESLSSPNRYSTQLIFNIFRGRPPKPKKRDEFEEFRHEDLAWDPEAIERFSVRLKGALAHEYQHLVDLFGDPKPHPAFVTPEYQAYKADQLRKHRRGQELQTATDILQYLSLASEVRAWVREIVTAAAKRREPVLTELEARLNNIRAWLSPQPDATPETVETGVARMRALYKAELARRYPRLKT